MPIPTIVFLTALPLEYDAVIAHLPDGQIETRHNGGATYYVSEYVTPANRRWQVAVRKLSAMGNYEAAQESIDAISDFFPSYMFFVGVAGGIKDVQLGDVVASSMARGYESVKVEETVIKQRAHVEYPSRQLVELAFQIASQSQWRSKIKLPEGQPKAQVCPIASGEKVITSPEFLKQLLQCCSDAVAVEMEAIGFLRTFRKRSQVQGIVIRGISDMVAGKNPEHDQKWQPIAARHAAGFAWAMVEELPIPTVIPQELPPLRIFAVPVSQRNEYFTGREEILKQMGELLAQQRVVAVHGLGGVGKTQTMVQYAYLHRADYAAIFWMLAASVNDFHSSFRALAQTLQLPTESLKQEDVERNVKLWLTTHSDWLLLLDNADELALVKTFVADMKEHGQVLISTRAVATRPVAVPVAVDKMTAEEGAQFLLKRTGKGTQEWAAHPEYATACQLVTLLDGLPLALEQAAAYIDENQSSFAEYLQDYQRYAKQLLARRGELFDEKDHPLPVAATWQASLEKIGQRSPQTLELLNACAFLPAEGIPEEILQKVLTEEYLHYVQSRRNFFTRLLFRVKWFFKVRKQLYQFVMKVASTEEYQQIEDFKASWAFMQNEKRKFRYVPSPLDSFQLKQLVEPALAYSMITRNAQTKQLSIHRLVQMVLKFELTTEVQRQWAERVIATVNNLFPNRDDIQHWTTYDRLLPSALTCAELIESYSIKTEVAVQLLNWTAYHIDNRKGEYDQALPLYQRALAICEQVLGQTHPLYAQNLNHLAGLYRAKGDYDQSLPLSERALAIDEQVLGPVHPSYATSLYSLAKLYQAKGNYDQALPLYQRALAIEEQVLGQAHPSYAQSLNSLAGLYSVKGDYDQALPLFERALAIFEQVLGPAHPRYATSLNSLAALYQDKGEYDQALPLYERALAIYEQMLGPAHPFYATSLNNLAGLYRAKGEYDQALPLYERALAIREQVLGPAHPDYATSLHDLASLYRDRGDYDQALPLYQRALAIYEQVLGPAHLYYATSLHNLAGLYKAKGDYDQALPLYERALTIYKKVLKEEHPWTKMGMENYQQCLSASQKTADDPDSALDLSVYPLHPRYSSVMDNDNIDNSIDKGDL